MISCALRRLEAAGRTVVANGSPTTIAAVPGGGVKEFPVNAIVDRVVLPG